MKFTTWQIDKLIRGLHAYRVMKAANNRLLPWKTVLDHLLLSPETEYQYPEDGSEPEFKEEALRRFAAGTSTLEAAKLADVASFLIAKRVLTQGELSEDAGFMTEGLILHARFAADPVSALLRFSNLTTTYRATRNNGGRVEDFELRFTPHSKMTLMHAEERLRVTASGSTPTTYETKDRNIDGVVVRKGCALITSEYPTLHVFLRSGSQHDLIHYVCVGTDAIQGQSSLLLVRSGAVTPEEPEGVEGDDVLARYNIVRFSPAAARTVLPPRKA
jgi:hypothetical protein